MKIKITENQRILLLTESKVDDLIVKYCDRFKQVDVPCNDDLKRILSHIDPTPTKKYLEWIIKKIVLIDSEMIFHGADYVHDYMKRFNDLLEKNQLEKRDINSYETYEELQLAVLSAEEKKSKKDLSGQYKKIFEDGQYIMVRPLTEEASCRFGVDTKWCISSKLSNRFKQYTEGDKNEFYFIIKKGESRGKLNRVAVQISDFGRITVWNAEDHVEKTDILTIFPDGIVNFILKRSEELRPKDCHNFDVSHNKLSLGDLGRFLLHHIGDGSDNFIAGYSESSRSPNNEDFLYVKVEKEGNSKVRFSIIYFIGDEAEMVDSTVLDCNSPHKLIEEFENRVRRYYPALRKTIRRITAQHEDKSLVFWRPTNVSSSYSFTKPGASKLLNKFIDYIKEQNGKGEPATKKDFIKKNYGHNRPGFLVTFFSSIKAAGIVKMDKNYNYSIGPNYEAYLQGKLRKF